MKILPESTSNSSAVEEILEMQNCNPYRKPVDTKSKLGPDDLSYVVQHVYLYMHDPRDPHFTTLEHIMRYVCGTVYHGLQIHVSYFAQLAHPSLYHSFRRHPRGGLELTQVEELAKLINPVVLTQSPDFMCEVTLSRSNVEAEYRGVANVIAETAWIRNLLR
ncbi:ribonuclease H-like domain-containing protein [Tanacetum coccineum]